MKTAFKKSLALVLAAVMLLCALPFTATAYSGTCGDNLTWSLNTSTGVLNITGTGAMTDYSYISQAPWCSYQSYIKTVKIGNSVTTIGSFAFQSCYSLTDITVDANNKYYSNDSDGVLFNKDKTTLIQYPIGNTRTSYTIPDSVTIIGERAFEYCDSLTNVTIPDSVTTIGDEAFYSCDNLTSITIPDSATTIGDGAFCACDSLTNIAVDINNKYYSIDSYGVLFNKDKTTLVQYPIGNTRTSYTIPDSVTTIGNRAFSFCKTLTNVTIPDSVTTIGGRVFWHCRSLTSVTIPDSVTTIGSGAFYLCDSLTSATIGNSVKTISLSAFEDCTTLTSVTIGNSVKTIGHYAFYYCDNITDVYYTVTEAQWKKISIGSYNNPLSDATIYFISELKLRLKQPYVTTINYGETLVLHLEDVELPKGYAIEWSIIGDAVTMSASDDGKECRITSTASGNVSVTATLVDENGEPVINNLGNEIFTDINIKSNANFWLKIVSFFKNLFGINRIIY